MRCQKLFPNIDDAKSGITTITMSGEVSDADINEAVEEAGFKVE